MRKWWMMHRRSLNQRRITSHAERQVLIAGVWNYWTNRFDSFRVHDTL